MATSDSALLTLSLTAELGVSGDIADVADVIGSRKRRLQRKCVQRSVLLCLLLCIGFAALSAFAHPGVL